MTVPQRRSTRQKDSVLPSAKSVVRPSLAERFKKLALGQFPSVIESVSWSAVSQHFAPGIRKHLRSMKAKPPHEI